MNSLQNWSDIPDHILVHTLSYVGLGDRFRASLVCKSWNSAFHTPSLWSRFKFRFHEENQTALLNGLDKYGNFLKVVYIELNQAEKINRENACKVITELASVNERRLQSLRIQCKGENPLFYTGAEFITALRHLFGPVPKNVTVVNTLKLVDLSLLPVALHDDVIDLLANHHPDLEKLNLINSSLVCGISASCVLRLVNKCRKLKDLRIFYSSMSDDVLEAFMEEDRKPLEHLGMMCRREEKYTKDLSEEAWQKLVDAHPNLRVTLAFDNTCPLHKVLPIMQPQIPVKELRLETFTRIYSEINYASEYYKKTLKKIVVQTRPSPELNKALLRVAENCLDLNSIHVFCVLEKSTIDKILSIHPILVERGSYTLKDTLEPHPWIAGHDC